MMTVNGMTFALCAIVVLTILSEVRQASIEAAQCRDSGGIVITVEGQTACEKVLSTLH